MQIKKRILLIKNLNLFTGLFFTFIFLLNACDTTTDDDNKQEETQSPLVGTWETEDSWNLEKGMKCTYEISLDNKFSYKMEYIYDVMPDGETVLIEKGKFIKINGNLSITENKIIATDLKVSEESTINKEVQAEMVQEPLTNMEIEYKDLTESSVKIKDVYYNEDGTEFEEWITLVKVGESTENNNTGNSDNNNDNNTEYSIIGSRTNAQTVDTIDGGSMEIKVTYVITVDKITSYAEFNGQKSTYEMTITKIENGEIYCTGLSPVDNTTEVTSIIMYKDLTADSVKITTVENTEDDAWLTFTKVK